MNDAWRSASARDVVRRILESGYNLDFFDDALLAATARSGRSGRPARLRRRSLQGRGPARVERIPLATLRKLDEFARAGGIVIATRRMPARAPGFLASAADHEAVTEPGTATLRRLRTPAGVFRRVGRHPGSGHRGPPAA